MYCNTLQYYPIMEVLWVLVNRWGIYLTVCTHNWSAEFNYKACNDWDDFYFRAQGHHVTVWQRLPRAPTVKSWHSVGF